MKKHGLGLIQILNLIAILTVMITLSLKRIEALRKKIRSSYYKLEVQDFMQSIELSLMNSRKCEYIFEGTSLNNLSTAISKFEDLASVGDSFGFRDMFTITSNGLVFEKINEKYFDVVFKLEVNHDVFAPRVIERRIPVFYYAQQDKIITCFHDPSDDNPYDLIPDGHVSKGLITLCEKEKMLDHDKMECNIHGFEKLPSPGGIAHTCADNELAAGIKFDESTGQYSLNCVKNNFYVAGEDCDDDWMNLYTSKGWGCSKTHAGHIMDNLGTSSASGCSSASFSLTPGVGVSCR